MRTKTYKLVFAIVYTFVMLPFSVTFFHHIATPPGDARFLGFIPLTTAHNFMLPCFLAIIEFSSINIAFLLWSKAETAQRKIMLAVLFFACQSFPVVSVYYDIVAKEYTAATSNVADTQAVNGERIAAVKAQIADINADLVVMREQNRIKRDSSLMNKKNALYAELSKLQAQKYDTAAKVTELEFVRNSVATSKGTLPMFLSFLFPVTIISFARVIKPEPKPVGQVVAAPKKKKAVKKKMEKSGAAVEQAIAQTA